MNFFKKLVKVLFCFAFREISFEFRENFAQVSISCFAKLKENFAKHEIDNFAKTRKRKFSQPPYVGGYRRGGGGGMGGGYKRGVIGGIGG